MKITIGPITKKMYYANDNTILSPEYVPDGTPLKKYTVPLKGISPWDIERLVFYNTETKKVELESLRTKSARLQNLFLIEKEEKKPIITIDYCEEYEKMDTAPYDRNSVEKKDGRPMPNRRRDY